MQNNFYWNTNDDKVTNDHVIFAYENSELVKNRYLTFSFNNLSANDISGNLYSFKHLNNHAILGGYTSENNNIGFDRSIYNKIFLCIGINSFLEADMSHGYFPHFIPINPNNENPWPTSYLITLAKGDAKIYRKGNYHYFAMLRAQDTQYLNYWYNNEATTNVDFYIQGEYNVIKKLEFGTNELYNCEWNAQTEPTDTKYTKLTVTPAISM
jgi:hypothetical protein